MDEDRPEAATNRWLGPHERQSLFHVADPRTRSKNIFHAAVVLLLGLLVPAILVVVALDALAAAAVTEESAPVTFLSVQTTLQFVGMGLVGIGFLVWRADPSLVGLRVPTRRDVVILFAGLAAFVGTMLGFELLVSLLDIEVAENVAIERGREHPELFLVFVPIQFLLVAPAEELLFRGVIQGLLRRAYGVVPGILGAGVLFSLVHIPALAGSSGQMATLAVILVTGCLLGALYEYSGNLAVPVIIHAVWNALVFATQYAGAVDALASGW